MEKKENSSTRASRKRKQPPIFSPPSRREEKAITHALHLSLRKIPANGEISEDEVGSDDEDFEESEGNNDDEVEDEPEQYETKWSNKLQPIRVGAFNQRAGPKKTFLPGRV